MSTSIYAYDQQYIDTETEVGIDLVKEWWAEATNAEKDEVIYGENMQIPNRESLEDFFRQRSFNKIFAKIPLDKLYELEKEYS